MAVDRLIASGQVRPIFPSQLSEIEPTSVRLETPVGPTRIGNDYVFIFAGGVPPFGLLRQMGVRFGGEPNVPATA